MQTKLAIPAVIAMCVGMAGAAWPQSAPAPVTTPPEKLQGSTTEQNPATAVAPPPQPANNAVSTSSQTIPGAPVAGANSFTESEARARIEGSGFAQVGALKLDSKGIWRGTASKDGKSGSVSLDYQGNVVAE